MYRQFYRVFEIFKLENKPKPAEADKAGATNESNSQQKKTDEKAMDEDDDDPEEVRRSPNEIAECFKFVIDFQDKKDDKEKLSKRKLKKLTRLSVAELKQLVNRPDVVEMHDVTARDPKLLVQLKAHRNTVQVPRHWCFKRKVRPKKYTQNQTIRSFRELSVSARQKGYRKTTIRPAGVHQEDRHYGNARISTRERRGQVAESENARAHSAQDG